jgi:hypothetical protein
MLCYSRGGNVLEPSSSAGSSRTGGVGLSERLESWKEIAAYLKKDVRTVQRWEAEGLPVHRLPHAKQGRVFAYKTEIDSWWVSRVQSARLIGDESVEPAETEASAAAFSSAKDKTRFRPWVTASVLMLTAALALLLLAWRGSSANLPGPVLELWQENNELIAVTTGNRVAWRYSVPEKAEVLEGTHPWVVSAGGGNPIGVYAILTNTVHASSRVLFFSNSGGLLWAYKPSDILRFQDREFGPEWRVVDVRAARVDGEMRTFVVICERNWWPSEVQELDMHGRVLQRFVNSGYLRDILIDNNSVIARGFSNSRNSWVLAVLNAQSLSGTSPEEQGEFQCSNCPSGSPLKYFVFPHSELGDILGPRYNDLGEITPLDRSGFGVVFCEGLLGQTCAESDYEFSPNLEPRSAQFTNSYWDVHQLLEAPSRLTLKHSKNQCPDRNGPQTVQRWTPQTGWTIVRLNQPPQ